MAMTHTPATSGALVDDAMVSAASHAYADKLCDMYGEGDCVQTAMRAALESVAAALARPADAKVARGDAARINAIQRNLWFVEPDYAGGGWRVGKAADSGQSQHYAPTLRGAIDLAIASPSPPVDLGGG